MKKSSLILMFIVLGVLLVPSVLGGPLGDAWDKILEIGSLSFLGVSADTQLVGFIRVAIAVLIFSLLYMGLSLIPGMSKNIAITVGIILAIITAVFLPASILIAFGGTYSTIFALLILGAPLLGIGWLLFKTPTPGRFWAGVKFFGVIFMIWLVNEIAHWATKVSGTVTMLVDFSGFVETFAGWANIALIIVLLYFGFLMIKGERGGEIAAEWGAKAWEGGKKLTRKLRRAEKAVLAEYVAEKKEKDLLEDVKHSIEKKEEASEIAKKAKKAKRFLNRRVKRFTRRMYRYNKRLSEAGKKIKKFDTARLDSFRNEVLERHRVMDINLSRVIEGKNAKKNIEEAIGHEEAALKMLQGMVALEKELLKE